MMAFVQKQVIGIPIGAAASYTFERAPKRLLHCASNQSSIQYSSCVSNGSSKSRQIIKLGHKLTETVKGKLRLGARILRVGGLEKVFKQNFSVGEDEKLIQASQCYLSTTAGPIAGILFISTDKVAFCSEKSIKIISPDKKPLRIRYKVSIPLRKIERAAGSENVRKPSQKYIQVVTEDKFEFWFMGFLNHQKNLRYLKQTIYEAQM